MYTRRRTTSIPLVLAVCALLFSGCSTGQVLGSKEYNYSVTVVQSPAHTYTASYQTDQSTITAQELLNNAGISYQTQMQNTEVITSLGGVLRTARHAWVWYIDGVKQTPDTIASLQLTPQSTTLLQYEAL